VELAIVLVEGAIQEVESEAGEAVLVGDHNFCDASALDGVQKGEEATTLVVEAGRDVGDDAVVPGTMGFELVDLAVEVSVMLLFGTRNASIEDCVAFFAFFTFPGGSLSEDSA